MILRPIFSNRKIKKAVIVVFSYFVSIKLILESQLTISSSEFLTRWYFKCHNQPESLSYISNERHLECLQKSTNLKSIQLLTQYYGRDDWILKELGQKPFEHCAETRCYAFRYMVEEKPLNRADGVIVHIPDLRYSPKSIPEFKRRREQLWSFFVQKSAKYAYSWSNYTIQDLNDWFNLTWTVKSENAEYKYDLKRLHMFADFVNAFRANPNPKLPIESFSLKPKTGALAFWFVDECSPASINRESFVNELAKHIRIDIYGKCGVGQLANPCENNTTNPQKCLVDLFDSYKFYLAFESSNCNNYISNEYYRLFSPFNILAANVLPVVQGARMQDYLAKSAQAKSFVYAPKYKTPKLLAHFLLYLAANQTAYLEYFTWKLDFYKKLNESTQQSDRKFEKGVDGHWPFCDICAQVHNQTFLHNNNPIIKISDYYNPEKECSKEEKDVVDQLMHPF